VISYPPFVRLWRLFGNFLFGLLFSDVGHAGRLENVEFRVLEINTYVV
jgi:hypothetical protein